jgi:hypothetical protein
MAGPVKVLGISRIAAASGMIGVLDMSFRTMIPASSSVTVGGL